MSPSYLLNSPCVLTTAAPVNPWSMFMANTGLCCQHWGVTWCCLALPSPSWCCLALPALPGVALPSLPLPLPLQDPCPLKDTPAAPFLSTDLPGALLCSPPWTLGWPGWGWTGPWVTVLPYGLESGASWWPQCPGAHTSSCWTRVGSSSAEASAGLSPSDC